MCKERGFDPAKVEFLENYVKELSQQIGVLKDEDTSKESVKSEESRHHHE